MPAGTAALFEQHIASIPESKRDSWRYHHVVPEDTLASIARTYRVQVGELAAANQMGENDKLDGVEALIVPVPPAAAPSAHTVLYTTRRGDTLVSIADRFGVSLSQLRRWNKLGPSGIRVEAGRTLARRRALARSAGEQASSRISNGERRAHAEIASATAPSHDSPSTKKATKKRAHTSKTGQAGKSEHPSSAAKSKSRQHSQHRNTSARAQK